jgi:valyl-tRNA synthetase
MAFTQSSEKPISWKQRLKLKKFANKKKKQAKQAQQQQQLNGVSHEKKL